MRADKQIQALLHLVDDPDKEVFDTVAGRLLSYGREIIPNLEQLWEITEDETVQERIEILIHRALISELQQELIDWAAKPNPSLLQGAILVARYRYPDLNEKLIMSQFEQMRRNIWLELNHYLTPLEQINVINSILYNYYKLQGHEITERKTDHFFINLLFENKHGNAYTIGVVFLALCEQLDVPVHAVALPRQFVMGYFDQLYSFLSPDQDPVQQLQFYVDPVNGMVYTQNDVDVYLKKINVGKEDHFFEPVGNVGIICRMLKELAFAYEFEDGPDKSQELRNVVKAITKNPL